MKSGWKAVYEQCGVNGLRPFRYAPGADAPANNHPETRKLKFHIPVITKESICALRARMCSGDDHLRAGTIIPQEAITGRVLKHSNNASMGVDHIVGKIINTLLPLPLPGTGKLPGPTQDLCIGEWGCAILKCIGALPVKYLLPCWLLETTELELTIQD